MKKLLAAGVSLLTLSSIAGAQETRHFNGPFLGGEIGYLSEDNDFDGLYYGVNGGIRVQTRGNVVYGIEGSYGKSDVDVVEFGDFSAFPLDDVVDDQWSLFGTVGYVFGAKKRDLVYGGLGYAKIDAFAFSVPVPDNGVAGLVAYERAIGSNMFARAKVTTYEFETYIGTIGFGLRF